MADRAPYSFGAAPLRDPIAGELHLTQPWLTWFVYLQRQFLIRWEDLRMPAQAIDIGTAARDAASGLLAFSGVADNAISGVALMPRGWLPGSVVRPYIRLRFPAASLGVNTRWQFGYDIAEEGTDWTNTSGTYTTLSTITVPNPAVTERLVSAQFGDLSMAGFSESACVLWQVVRLAGTDALDDDVSTCVLLEVDIRHQVQKAGTVAEGTP